MNSIKNTFLKGFLAVVPITATIFLLVWLARSAEGFFGEAIRLALPEEYYVPGMGVVAAFSLIFAIGILLNAWVAQRFLSWTEDILQKLPLIKSIYSPMKDLMGLFSTNSKDGLSSVVMVDFGDDRKLFGLMTREDFSDIGLIGHEDKVAVYFPMSYQIGGYTLLIPKSQVTDVDLPVDKALSLMVTGWVKAKD